MGVQLHQDGDLWRLTLVDGDDAFSAPVGAGTWQTNPTETDQEDRCRWLSAAAGLTSKRSGPRSFSETPHRLELTCSLTTGTFQASWRTTPLHPGRLSELA